MLAGFLLIDNFVIDPAEVIFAISAAQSIVGSSKSCVLKIFDSMF